MPPLCDSLALAEFLSTQLGKFPQRGCEEPAAQLLGGEEGPLTSAM